jgi:hypothetical protein
VTDWEPLAETVKLPDPDDRHVARRARSPPRTGSAVRAVAGRTGRSGPPMTARDIAAYLQAHSAPVFGERLLVALG